DQVQAMLAVGQVFDVGYPGELFRADQVLDPGDHFLRADVVGELGDNDPGAARCDLVDPCGRAGPEGAPAGLVGFAHPVQALHVAAGGQVGAGHEPHQLVERGVGVGDQVPGGGDDLAEVVRGHVGGHADRDPGGAVDQQVGQAGRQHLGLDVLAVVVG